MLVRAVLVLAAGACVPSLLYGCTTTSPSAALRDTSQLIQRRSGIEIAWFGEGGGAEARSQVTAILSAELTLANAVRVSLLANRDLQAMYDELGIAQADLVQAGLLKNPTLAATYHLSLDDGSGPGIELSLVTEFVQLLTRGSRRNLAQLALEGTKYRVAGDVLHHVYEVKVAYFSMLAAQQTLAMRRIVTEAAQAALELARRQNATGTISELDLANEEALFGQVSVDLEKSKAEVTTTRETLNQLMGVWGADTNWKTNAKLPELPIQELSFGHIEAKAIAQRYDLVAASKDVEVLSYALSLAKNTRWLGGVDAGVRFEKTPERIRLFGPTVSVELPIFDQRQASIARIASQLRQAKSRETSLAVGIRAESRKVVGKLAVSRAVVEGYQRTLVPVRQRIVALSQQQYDAMLLGVFQLLIAKQNEISTYRDFIDALRDYWNLRAELEWKTGGSEVIAVNPPTKSVVSPQVSPVDSSQPGSPHEHHAP